MESSYVMLVYFENKRKIKNKKLKNEKSILKPKRNNVIKCKLFNSFSSQASTVIV